MDIISHEISPSLRETKTIPETGNIGKLASARIMGVGIGLPSNRYSQKELLDIFKIDDPRVKSLYLNSWIKTRYLTLPPCDSTGERRIETQGELIQKHTRCGLAMGREAIMRCLEEANFQFSDIHYICCVSSTGFITPGFSALLIKDLGLRRDCSRLDVVGMGCNAGLNALTVVSAWANANPGKLAVMVCVEVCSAAYVFDNTMRTSVVNSLFGDGAAAITVIAGKQEEKAGAISPSLIRFSSCIIPEEIDAMRYEWDDEHEKFSFYLAPETPYVVGAYAEEALRQLLDGTGVRSTDIKYWLVHSGGKKVIDSVRVNLGLTRHDVRHTIGVLQDHGNVSSASFLFSYERLLREGVIVVGDYGVMMTMGPGATIEMALLYWN